MKNKTLKQILSALFIVVVAGLGSLFVNLGTNWFSALQKPSQWIPDFVIPVVWSVIYILFAVFVVLLIKDNKINKKLFVWLGLNGFLNVLWCLLFFTLHLTFVGLVAIVLNLICGWILYINLDNTRYKYIQLLSIYPIWLCLATCLNLCLWILN